jgi:hypothetical protein
MGKRRRAGRAAGCVYLPPPTASARWPVRSRRWWAGGVAGWVFPREGWVAGPAGRERRGIGPLASGVMRQCAGSFALDCCLCLCLPRRGRRVRLRSFSIVISVSPCVFFKRAGRGGPASGNAPEVGAGKGGAARPHRGSILRFRPRARGVRRARIGCKEVQVLGASPSSRLLLGWTRRSKNAARRLGRVGASTASPGGWMSERTCGSWVSRCVWVTVMFSDRQRMARTGMGQVSVSLLRYFPSGTPGLIAAGTDLKEEDAASRRGNKAGANLLARLQACACRDG